MSQKNIGAKDGLEKQIKKAQREYNRLIKKIKDVAGKINQLVIKKYG